jgi:ferredoxin-NADP reductase
MICGPPNFMKSITNILEKNGVAEHDIQSEAFQQGSIFESGVTYRAAFECLFSWVFCLAYWSKWRRHKRC